MDDGPLRWGLTACEFLLEGTEGSLYLGPEQPRVYSDHVTGIRKDRYNADISGQQTFTSRFTIRFIYLLIIYTDAKDIWDNVKMLLRIGINKGKTSESQLDEEVEHFRQKTKAKPFTRTYYVRVKLGRLKCYNCNGVGHIARHCTQPKRLHKTLEILQRQDVADASHENELSWMKRVIVPSNWKGQCY
ncbi:retrovirus-related pol polyprotein from transposon TNT 1-94 [Tanacetum coccineum]